MTKVLVVTALAIATIVGCTAPDADESPMITSSVSNARAAGAGECSLGDGLYCGGNGVNGLDSTLYRRTDGRVAIEQLCPSCERMPDGQNDRCGSPVLQPEQGGEQPELEAPKPAAPAGKASWAGCGADGECASNRCGCNGASEKQCLPSADYPKTCAPAICGTGLTCSASFAAGATKCRQTASSSTSIYCCAKGKGLINGTCL